MSELENEKQKKNTQKTMKSRERSWIIYIPILLLIKRHMLKMKQHKNIHTYYPAHYITIN